MGEFRGPSQRVYKKQGNGKLRASRRGYPGLRKLIFGGFLLLKTIHQTAGLIFHYSLGEYASQIFWPTPPGPRGTTCFEPSAGGAIEILRPTPRGNFNFRVGDK